MGFFLIGETMKYLARVGLFDSGGNNGDRDRAPGSRSPWPSK